jgi:hypothetical protein
VQLVSGFQLQQKKACVRKGERLAGSIGPW